MNTKGLRKAITVFLRDENAQAMVEYIIVILVLTVASYGAIKLFSYSWKIKFNKIKMTRAIPYP